MLATLVPNPFHRPDWVFEEKYDGYRILAYKEGAQVTLLSRNGIDRTATFVGVAAPLWVSLETEPSFSMVRLSHSIRREFLGSNSFSAEMFSSASRSSIVSIATVGIFDPNHSRVAGRSSKPLSRTGPSESCFHVV
jgi:hypothetical protein